MDPSKYPTERAMVDQFLREWGHTSFALSDPNAGHKADTGADVLADLDGRRYGFQVTVYHADEGDAPQKGSKLRAQEAPYQAWPTAYAMYGKVSPLSGLLYRLQSKCAKRYPTKTVDHLVLLIAASLPEMGALVSTFLWDGAININEMNAILSPILKASVFDSAYLYNMMGVNFRSVYEWTKEEGCWHKVPRTGNPV